MKEFDKQNNVAVELLDAAVTEHLDHGRHFAAYNLAAVAEELMAKLLNCSRKKSSSDVKIGAVKAMSRALGQPEGNDKAWRRSFHMLKNTMKHMNSRWDQFFHANIQADARRKIGDAVDNLERLGLPKSIQVRRYDTYRQNRDHEDDL